MNEMKSQKPVVFEVVGDNKFEIRYNSPLLEDHLLDNMAVPEEERPGQMRRLLCASAAGCFVGSLYMALRNREVDIKSLKGTAEAFSAEDIGFLPQIKAIDIKVEIDIDDKDAETLSEIENTFEQGCLITRSLSPGIRVTHNIVRI